MESTSLPLPILLGTQLLPPEDLIPPEVLGDFGVPAIDAPTIDVPLAPPAPSTLIHTMTTVPAPVSPTMTAPGASTIGFDLFHPGTWGPLAWGVAALVVLVALSGRRQ